MTKALLITRPNHEVVTRYLYHYSADIISSALSGHFTVTDLSGRQANSKDFNRQIKNCFSLIILNGHGSPHVVYGWNDQPLITAPVSGHDYQKSIVYVRSCQTGRYLGPYLVKHNARAFIGYEKDFVFVSSQEENPQTDSLAKLFLEPSNLIAKKLIQGKTVRQADQQSKAKIRKNIRLVLKSRLQRRQQIAAFLWHNLNCQIVLGDDQAKVTAV